MRVRRSQCESEEMPVCEWGGQLSRGGRCWSGLDLGRWEVPSLPSGGLLVWDRSGCRACARRPRGPFLVMEEDRAWAGSEGGGA